MRTLYDLLGAHPDDDEKALKSAFRNAVKASHPDAHPDDPHAALRFRQIVRAHAILSDAEQRAAYDRLMEFEQSERTIPNTTNNIAAGAVVVGAFAVALMGATLFVQITKAPVPMVAAVEVTLHEPAEVTPTTPMLQRDTTVRDEPRRAPHIEAIVSSGVALVVKTVNADAFANGPVPDIASHDAKFYRQRGTLSYRAGDFYLAIANFDLAIRLDPNFEAAYIDRGITFYRIGDFKRAFADVTRAKRIRNLQGTKIPRSGKQLLAAPAG
jgi:curved DNA-binding protein CbpA